MHYPRSAVVGWPVLLIALFAAMERSAIAQRTLSDEEITSYIDAVEEYRSGFDSETIAMQIRVKVLADALSKKIEDEFIADKHSFKETAIISETKYRASTYVPVVGSLSSDAPAQYKRTVGLSAFRDPDNPKTTRLYYDGGGKPTQVTYRCGRSDTVRNDTSSIFLSFIGRVDSCMYILPNERRKSFSERLGAVTEGRIEPHDDGGHLITLIHQPVPRIRITFFLRDQPVVHCVGDLYQDLKTGTHNRRRVRYDHREERFVPVWWRTSHTTREREDGATKVDVFAAIECDLRELRFIEQPDDDLFELDIPSGVEVVDRCK